MNIIQQAKTKLKAPPPPPKPSHLTDTPKPPSPTKKRGIGWPWDYQSTLLPLFFPPTPSSPHSITWLFNWELWVPDSLSPEVEWIPTVRTGDQCSNITPYITDITTNKHRPVHALLGFNEPEIPSQANMSIDDAVRLWKDYVLPAREKLGLRLGSPGVSSDVGLCTKWLDGFFGQLGGIEASQVEFLVVHWYGVRFAEMSTYLELMYRRYRLPLWVNEFACSSMGNGEVSESDVEAFLREAVPWLDACEWVEKYAYFGNAQGQDVGSWVGKASNFTEKADGCEHTGGRRLTRIGKLYLDL